MTQVIVAIPARNEAERLPRCLRALAAQRGAPRFRVVVLANGCTDDTAGIARALAPALPYALRVEEAVLPPGRRHAGGARRAAMEAAADGAPRRAVLFGTDADGMAAPDWLARTLAHMQGGVEAVAGRAVLEPRSAALLPPAVLERCAQEALLARLLARLETLLDPLPWDPWPCHRGHWGANFAVTRAAWSRAGGIPEVPLAEDRAFFAALDEADVRVRHADDSVVRVSARAVGRAPGGMADVLARRAVSEDALCDALIEPLCHAVRRHRLRRALRDGADMASAPIARRLAMPPAMVREALRGRRGGDAWAALREASPSLAEQRLHRTRLAREIAVARRLVAALGGGEVAAPEGHSLV